MKLTIPEAGVHSASLASISIGHVGVGPISVGQLVLDNADITMSAAQAVLSNVRVTVTLRISLRWRVHVGLPWPFDDIDVGDSYDLGSPSFSVGVGNITVPGLDDVRITIPGLTAANVTVGNVDPITNLQVPAAAAERIDVRDLTLPSQGFTLSGLTFESVEGEAVGVPEATVGSVSVGRMHGSPIAVPVLTLGGLRLPTVAIPDITSRAPLDIPANLQARTFTMDAGLLDLSLTIRPSALSHVERLRITNAGASASVGQVVLRNVVLPYEVLNLTLSQIGINTIGIPAFTVA